MPRLAADDPRLVPIYKDVPAAQREVLVRFRAEHPLKEAVIGGQTWEYIDAGRGSRPLLLLPGDLSRLPPPARIMLRALFRKRTVGLLPDHPETALIRAYIREFADIHATKEVLVALYARMVDYYTTYDFKPGDLEGWPGRLLLLMSDNDPVTPEPVRKAQQAAYPMAEAHVFTGGGHAHGAASTGALLRGDGPVSGVTCRTPAAGRRDS